MVAIKGTEIPQSCSECERCFRECELSFDFDNYLVTRHCNCPLVEIGTCKDCFYYNIDEDGHGYHCEKYEHTRFPVYANFYCADFEKGGEA